MLEVTPLYMNLYQKTHYTPTPLLMDDDYLFNLLSELSLSKTNVLPVKSSTKSYTLNLAAYNATEDKNKNAVLIVDEQIIGSVVYQNNELIIDITNPIKLNIIGAINAKSCIIKSVGDIELESTIWPHTRININARNVLLNNEITADSVHVVAESIVLNAIVHSHNLTLLAREDCSILQDVDVHYAIVVKAKTITNQQTLRALQITLHALDVISNLGCIRALDTKNLLEQNKTECADITRFSPWIALQAQTILDKGSIVSADKLNIVCTAFKIGKSARVKSHGTLNVNTSHFDNKGQFTVKKSSFLVSSVINNKGYIVLPDLCYLSTDYLNLGASSHFSWQKNNFMDDKFTRVIRVNNGLNLAEQAHLTLDNVYLSGHSLSIAGVVVINQSRIDLVSLVDSRRKVLPSTMQTSGKGTLTATDTSIKVKMVRFDSSSNTILKNTTLNTVILKNNSPLVLHQTTLHTTTCDWRGSIQMVHSDLTNCGNLLLRNEARVELFNSDIQTDVALLQGNLIGKDNSVINTNYCDLSGNLTLDNSPLKAKQFTSQASATLTTAHNSQLIAERSIALHGQSDFNTSFIRTANLSSSGELSLSMSMVEASTFQSNKKLVMQDVNINANRISIGGKFAIERWNNDTNYSCGDITFSGNGKITHSTLRALSLTTADFSQMIVTGSRFLVTNGEFSGNTAFHDSNVTLQSLHHVSGTVSMTGCHTEVGLRISGENDSSISFKKSVVQAPQILFKGAVDIREHSYIDASQHYYSNNTNLSDSSLNAIIAHVTGTSTVEQANLNTASLIVNDSATIKQSKIKTANLEITGDAVIQTSFLEIENTANLWGETLLENTSLKAKTFDVHQHLKTKNSKVYTENTTVHVNASVRAEQTRFATNQFENNGFLKLDDSAIDGVDNLEFRYAATTYAKNSSLSSTKKIHHSTTSELRGESIKMTAETFNNQGSIQLQDSLVINANTFENYAEVSALKTLEIDAKHHLINIQGHLAADTIHLSSSSILSVFSDVKAHNLTTFAITDFNVFSAKRAYNSDSASFFNINCGIIVPLIPSRFSAMGLRNQITPLLCSAVTMALPKLPLPVDTLYKGYQLINQGKALYNDFKNTASTINSRRDIATYYESMHFKDGLKKALELKKFYTASKQVTRQINQSCRNLFTDGISLCERLSTPHQFSYAGVISTISNIFGPHLFSESVISLNAGIVFHNNISITSVVTINNGVNVANQTLNTNAQLLTNHGIMVGSGLNASGIYFYNNGFLGNTSWAYVNVKKIRLGYQSDLSHGLLEGQRLNLAEQVRLSDLRINIKERMSFENNLLLDTDQVSITTKTLELTGQINANQATPLSRHESDTHTAQIFNSAPRPDNALHIQADTIALNNITFNGKIAVHANRILLENKVLLNEVYLKASDAITSDATSHTSATNTRLEAPTVTLGGDLKYQQTLELAGTVSLQEGASLQPINSAEPNFLRIEKDAFIAHEKSNLCINQGLIEVNQLDLHGKADFSQTAVEVKQAINLHATSDTLIDHIILKAPQIGLSGHLRAHNRSTHNLEVAATEDGAQNNPSQIEADTLTLSNFTLDGPTNLVAKQIDLNDTVDLNHAYLNASETITSQATNHTSATNTRFEAPVVRLGGDLTYQQTLELAGNVSLQKGASLQPINSAEPNFLRIEKDAFIAHEKSNLCINQGLIEVNRLDLHGKADFSQTAVEVTQAINLHTTSETSIDHIILKASQIGLSGNLRSHNRFIDHLEGALPENSAQNNASQIEADTLTLNNFLLDGPTNLVAKQIDLNNTVDLNNAYLNASEAITSQATNHTRATNTRLEAPVVRLGGDLKYQQTLALAGNVSLQKGASLQPINSAEPNFLRIEKDTFIAHEESNLCANDGLIKVSQLDLHGKADLSQTTVDVSEAITLHATSETKTNHLRFKAPQINLSGNLQSHNQSSHHLDVGLQVEADSLAINNFTLDGPTNLLAKQISLNNNVILNKAYLNATETITAHAESQLRTTNTQLKAPQIALGGTLHYRETLELVGNVTLQQKAKLGPADLIEPSYLLVENGTFTSDNASSLTVTKGFVDSSQVDLHGDVDLSLTTLKASQSINLHRTSKSKTSNVHFDSPQINLGGDLRYEQLLHLTGDVVLQNKAYLGTNEQFRTSKFKAEKGNFCTEEDSQLIIFRGELDCNQVNLKGLGSLTHTTIVAPLGINFHKTSYFYTRQTRLDGSNISLGGVLLYREQLELAGDVTLQQAATLKPVDTTASYLKAERGTFSTKENSSLTINHGLLKVIQVNLQGNASLTDTTINACGIYFNPSSKTHTNNTWLNANSFINEGVITYQNYLGFNGQKMTLRDTSKIFTLEKNGENYLNFSSPYLAIGGILNVDRVAIQTNAINNIANLITKTGQYAEFKVSHSLSLTVQQDVCVNEPIKRQCGLDINGNTVELGYEYKTREDIKLQSTQGAVIINKNLDANNIAVKSATTLLTFTTLSATKNATFEANGSFQNLGKVAGEKIIILARHIENITRNSEKFTPSLPVPNSGIIDGTDVFLTATAGNVENYGGVIRGSNYLQIKANLLLNRANTMKKRGRFDEERTYESAAICGGQGENYENLGLNIKVAEIHNEASIISAVGHIHIDAKTKIKSIPFYHTFISNIQKKRGGLGRRLANRSREEITFTPVVKNSQFLSSMGYIYCNVEDGGLDMTATDIFSNDGFVVNLCNGDVQFVSLVTQQTTHVKRHNHWFHGSSHSQTHECVTPVLIANHGITILNSDKKNIYAKGLVVQSNDFFVFAPQGSVHFRADILAHTIVEKSSGMSLSLPALEKIKQFKQHGIRGVVNAIDPVFSKITAVAKANNYPEMGAHAGNLGLAGYNAYKNFEWATNQGALAPLLLERAGMGDLINPKFNISLKKRTSRLYFETLGPAGFQGNNFHCNAKTIQLENFPMSVAENMSLEADLVVLQGTPLQSSINISEKKLTIGVNLTGSINDVSADSSNFQQQSTHYENMPVYVGGNLDIRAQKVEISAATVDCNTLSGNIKLLEIESKQDTVHSKTRAKGASSNGRFSFFENQQRSAKVTQATRLHVRSGINHEEATQIVVEKTIITGAVISTDGINNFQSDVDAVAIHDYSTEKGHQIGGNVCTLYQSQTQLLEQNQQPDQIETINYQQVKNQMNAVQRSVIYGAQGSSATSHYDGVHTVDENGYSVTRDSKRNLNLDIPVNVSPKKLTSAPPVFILPDDNIREDELFYVEHIVRVKEHPVEASVHVTQLGQDDAGFEDVYKAPLAENANSIELIETSEHSAKKIIAIKSTAEHAPLEGINLFRGDGRPPEVVFQGIKAPGAESCLVKHVLPPDGGASNKNSRYISSSPFIESAIKFPMSSKPTTTYLYEFLPQKNAVNIVHALNPQIRPGLVSQKIYDLMILGEQEMAIPEKVSSQAIRGAYKVTGKTHSRVIEKNSFIPNPHYKPTAPEKFGRVAGVLGNVMTVYAAGIDAIKLYDSHQESQLSGDYAPLIEQSSKIMFAWSAAIAGGSTGAAKGAAACAPFLPWGPPVCAFVGGTIGSIVGYHAGEKMGEVVYDQLQNKEALLWDKRGFTFFKPDIERSKVNSWEKDFFPNR